jgi:hypothetical protein
MRILDIVTDPSKASNPQLSQRSQCAHCNRSYVFRRGILAKIEHETEEVERDEDGCRYLKRGVGVYAFHSIECFLAVIEPAGHA